MSAQKDYLSLPLRTFLTDLGEKTPTPGGGSVAALAGALSASLARMAVAYTLTRKEAREHHDRLEKLSGELQGTMESFCQLMQEDMVAYETFAATRKAGKPGEQKQAVLRAIAVPMEIIVLAGAVTAWADEIKGHVSRHLLSDLQSAAELASAAARAASTSVRTNLTAVADAREAERLQNKLDLLLARMSRHRNMVVHYEPT